MVERLAALLSERGDMGHVALFLWAMAASVLALILVRDLTRTAARFEHFVLAIAKLNAMIAADRAGVDDRDPADPHTQGEFDDAQDR